MRDTEVVSYAMSQVKGRDTSPELALRKALWHRGLRYRTNVTSLPGKPDIVFSGKRLLVFVDGDYWHGNQWLARGHASLEEQFDSVSGRDYWIHKLGRNMERDRRQTAELLQSGWHVIRFWESDLERNLGVCVERVVKAMSDQTCCGVGSRVAQRTLVEFFAGIGLVRLALEPMGWSTEFANDIDPKKHEMYRAHFGSAGSAKYLVKDIHQLESSEVPSTTLATASFPCTDLSLAGGRRGLQGEQSGSLLGFLKIIDEAGDHRPPMVMLENVPGFLSSHGGKDFELALRRLNALGYSVDAFFLDAVHFVPQSRNRLFVVGVQGEFLDGRLLGVGDPAEPYTRPPRLLSALSGIRGLRTHRFPLPQPPSRRADLRDILERVPHNSSLWWDSERVDYLLSQMSAKHRLVVDHLASSSKHMYGTVFRRVRHGKTRAELRADGVAGCLRTPRGGSSRQILLQAGRNRVRARLLTPRECARLQGVPDDFVISVGTNQALFGFGDAVCVPAIRWIADHYLNPVVSQLIRGEVLCSTFALA